MNTASPSGATGHAFRRKLRIAALLVFALGLAAAAAILVLAPPAEEEVESGVHVATLSNSKQYRRDIERIGGKAAVAAAEFNEWFDGLWHGRRLAATVLALSAIAALVCLVLARSPAVPQDFGGREGH